MAQKVELDEESLFVGKFVINILALEGLLRAFLHYTDKARYGNPPPEIDLDKLKVGQTVPENYFSNYDSLGTLVDSFNAAVVDLGGKELSVDRGLVEFRDALDHGRVPCPGRARTAPASGPESLGPSVSFASYATRSFPGTPSARFACGTFVTRCSSRRFTKARI